MENAVINEQRLSATPDARNTTPDTIAPFGLADLHLHTNYSDASGSVEDVLDFVQHQSPLNVIAITDHDTIEGALRARELVAAGGYRFELIVGEEISAREGHVLALFLHTPVPAGQSIERTIALIHAQGGLAVVAHPFNRVFRHSVQRTVMNRVLRQPAMYPDGIETLNGSFAGIGSSRIAMGLARSTYPWAETGGSDAHAPTAVGCARTRFPGRGIADLRRALEQRTTVPEGSYWLPREYVAFVSHRVAHGGGATNAPQHAPRLARRRAAFAAPADSPRRAG